MKWGVVQSVEYISNEDNRLSVESLNHKFKSKWTSKKGGKGRMLREKKERETVGEIVVWRAINLQLSFYAVVYYIIGIL